MRHVYLRSCVPEGNLCIISNALVHNYWPLFFSQPLTQRGTVSDDYNDALYQANYTTASTYHYHLPPSPIAITTAPPATTTNLSNHSQLHHHHHRHYLSNPHHNNQNHLNTNSPPSTHTQHHCHSHSGLSPPSLNCATYPSVFSPGKVPWKVTGFLSIDSFPHWPPCACALSSSPVCSLCMCTQAINKLCAIHQ